MSLDFQSYVCNVQSARQVSALSRAPSTVDNVTSMRCRFSEARSRNRRIFSYGLSSDGPIDRLKVAILASMMRPLCRQFQRPDARRLHTFAGHYQETQCLCRRRGEMDLWNSICQVPEGYI